MTPTQFACSFAFPVLISLWSGTATAVDFAHDVVPILKTHCAECHTGERSEGGFSFNTRRHLLESGIVVPKQLENSRLLHLITSTDPDDQMPPQDRPRLSAKEVNVIRSWVAAGLPWEPGFRFAESAWEPPLIPRPVDVPPASEGIRHPIDRILRSYLAEHDVDGLPPVDDLAFLRRVSLDLIGLPPTIEDQHHFLSLPAASRRESVIDSLLARDHDYAEHWMTFWNDLLRNDYAGTGYIDGGRKQITPWLYESLVANKPYDQFVTELIAPTPASAGFINGIKWRGNVNASQVREIQFAQNVSQVFLGINMKCASCHDSFIDRWTLDEAYGLAAIYSTRELQIHRCDKPVGRVAQAAWIFPEIGSVDPRAEQPERLRQLAEVLTSAQNGRFSRTIVNRLWHRLTGYGIVHPVDAMHTRPWNDDLLEYLAAYLVESKYDLKAVLKLIVTSRAYQSASAAMSDGEEYVFRGPLRRHLTAEQFQDCVWAIGDTGPRTIRAPIPIPSYFGADHPMQAGSGQWIWSHDQAAHSPAGETAAFRRTIHIDTASLTGSYRAKLIVTCDNGYTAFVNGRRVGTNRNWQKVDAFDVSKILKPGINEIIVQAKNEGDEPNPAGLYVELVVVPPSGPTIRVATDASWQATAEKIDPSETDAVVWKPAVPVQNQDFLPAKVRQSIDLKVTQAVVGRPRPVRAALLKSDLLMRSLGRPNREQVVTTRPESLSTLQAIDLANGQILDDMLRKSAETLHNTLPPDADERIDILWRRTLCREPLPAERRLAQEVLGNDGSVEAVQDLLWMLVMLPEFQFIR